MSEDGNREVGACTDLNLDRFVEKPVRPRKGEYIGITKLADELLAVEEFSASACTVHVHVPARVDQRKRLVGRCLEVRVPGLPAVRGGAPEHRRAARHAAW